MRSTALVILSLGLFCLATATRNSAFIGYTEPGDEVVVQRIVINTTFGKVRAHNHASPRMTFGQESNSQVPEQPAGQHTHMLLITAGSCLHQQHTHMQVPISTFTQPQHYTTFAAMCLHTCS